jgi:hypothetical protein
VNNSCFRNTDGSKKKIRIDSCGYSGLLLFVDIKLCMTEWVLIKKKTYTYTHMIHLVETFHITLRNAMKTFNSIYNEKLSTT